jgi:hypothetical protein
VFARRVKRIGGAVVLALVSVFASPEVVRQLRRAVYEEPAPQQSGLSDELRAKGLEIDELWVRLNG